MPVAFGDRWPGLGLVCVLHVSEGKSTTTTTASSTCTASAASDAKAHSRACRRTPAPRSPDLLFTQQNPRAIFFVRKYVHTRVRGLLSSRSRRYPLYRRRCRTDREFKTVRVMTRVTFYGIRHSRSDSAPPRITESRLCYYESIVTIEKPFYLLFRAAAGRCSSPHSYKL